MIIHLLFSIFLSFTTQAESRLKINGPSNLGCPEFSKCSKKVGVIRQQWIEIAKSNKKQKIKILQSFSQSFGTPLSIWGKNKAEADDRYIIWDSPCKNHNLEEEPKISLVDVFSKNLLELKKSNDIIVPQGLLLNSKNEIEVIDLLRSDAPILLSKNSVFYVKEVEGIYYSLELKRNGKINLLKTPSVTNSPREVQCPKELGEKFKSLELFKNLYKGHYCKKIWDISSNSYQVLALGWSCN